MKCRPGGGRGEGGLNNAYFAALLPKDYVYFVCFFLQTSNEQQCVAVVAWVASGAVVALGAVVASVA